MRWLRLHEYLLLRCSVLLHELFEHAATLVLGVRGGRLRGLITDHLDELRTVVHKVPAAAEHEEKRNQRQQETEEASNRPQFVTLIEPFEVQDDLVEFGLDRGRWQSGFRCRHGGSVKCKVESEK